MFDSATPMDCNMSDSPILYYFLEFAQIHEIAFLLARYFLTISCLKAGPYLFCLVYPRI